MRLACISSALLVAILTGCGSSDGNDCRANFERASDGHCYPTSTESEPVAFDQALANLEPCEPLKSAGTLDLAAGCALGACAGTTFTQFQAALKREPVCATSSTNDLLVYCTWESLGIDGLFDDADEDGIPDADSRSDRVHVFGSATSTVTGAGVGAQLSCIVDELGLPDELRLVDDGNLLVVEQLRYDRYGAYAYDEVSADGGGQPDGIVDEFYLYGSL